MGKVAVLSKIISKSWVAHRGDNGDCYLCRILCQEHITIGSWL